MSGELLILCYHAVSETWPWEGAVRPRALERQLRHLLGRGYRPLTLAAALAPGAAGRRLVVSFDDAFGSVLGQGLPVLRRLGVPATLFVPTDFAAEGAPMTWSRLGRWVGTPYEEELRCMPWDGVRELAAAGWEIGSHTCSHPRLTEVGQEQAVEELSRSKRICEVELDRPCSAFAYPFGLRDEGLAELARASGYGAAVTLGERLLGPRSRDRMGLSREGVYRGTRWPQFRAATSPFFGNLRSRPLYKLIGSS